MSQITTFLDELNDRYLTLHEQKERAFWDTRMGITDRGEELARADLELRDLVNEGETLKQLRAHRQDPACTDAEVVVLDGWIELFRRNVIEDDEARRVLTEIVNRETELQRSRRDLDLGYRDPASGEFVAASSVALSTGLRAGKDEAYRKACWDGLRTIEPHVLEHGYLDIVKLRNRFARRLGFEDYYDYKVNWSEGFSKAKLFELLDDLEERTRGKANRELRNMTEREGESVILPWNFTYHVGGSLADEREPYFRFEDAVERWVRSFAALGIGYSGATVTVDLVHRDGKYENGFMHGPRPAFLDHGAWRPAEINFCANAIPDQTGSGQRALQTLFHEGGHAAHFANVRMDAACFSQEYAPTSAALAETQSMFLDSLIGDADWQTRYARDDTGSPIPFSLIEKSRSLTQPFQAFRIRSMLVVCYCEKAIYEMPEEDLTPENVLSVVREVEDRLVQLPGGSPRPVLSVPHLLDWDASANYQGYVLAQMAVAQTRDYFREKYGHLLDNPEIGRELAATYWAPGNSRTFLEMVESMTGKPLKADGLVDQTNLSVEESLARAREQVAGLERIPEFDGDVDLDVRLAITHGAETVVEAGTPPLEAAETFRSWVRSRWPR